MANVTISTDNTQRPAPKLWRKLENVLLIILIPSATTIIMGWGIKDELFVAKLLLSINTGLVAIIKAIGMLLANGEVYASANIAPIVIQPLNSSVDGQFGVWYYDGAFYYYWDGKNYVKGGGDRPKDPPPNP